METRTIKLEGKTEFRSLDELKQLLNYMIEKEDYEQCVVIKFVIDNYDTLCQELTN